jgi:hypothetical protein
MTKALVLIPCCENKKESIASGQYPSPLAGLADIRSELTRRVRNTPDLFNRPDNRRNLESMMETKTLAIDLYAGKLYQSCRMALSEVVSGLHPSICVLIVSALYGLVRLDEGINIYELKMSDRLLSGERICEYWQANGLSVTLARYIEDMGIGFIWSLLPKTDYHAVFSDLWPWAREKSIACFKVEIPGVRQASGCLRGKWLSYMISARYQYLLLDPVPPSHIPEVSKHGFIYDKC